MPEIVDSFEGSSAGRWKLYDFTLWADGNIREFVRGTDYGTAEGFRSAAYKWGKRNDFKVKSRISEDRSWVRLQFVKIVESEGETE